MFVTTGGRTDDKNIEKAKQAAEHLNLPYVSRQKRSIAHLQKMYGEDCLVIGRKRPELYKVNEAVPFFFHPNVAMLRIKRLQKGELDPFVYAAGIKDGSRVLDCTLGLGADAIVASLIAGKKGIVQGIEENRLLSFVVKEGLEQWSSGSEAIDQSFRRVEVRTANHLDVLQSSPSGSFDVVYFDPMFEDTIAESDGIRSLTYFAAKHELSEETIEEAKRVAKQRVVLKDHFRSDRFARFGFQVIVRKTSKFHFGCIDV
jgi:predicted methyltransferase